MPSVVACPLAELPIGKGLALTLAGKPVALFRIADGEVVATEGACPHRGGPLGEGLLEGCRLTCPWHAWSFDLRTGESITHPGTVLLRYPARIAGGEVLVEVP